MGRCLAYRSATATKGQCKQMTYIFLSYAREDRHLADTVVRGLKTAGFSVWIDSQLPVASKWAQSKLASIFMLVKQSYRFHNRLHWPPAVSNGIMTRRNGLTSCEERVLFDDGRARYRFSSEAHDLSMRGNALKNVALTGGRDVSFRFHRHGSVEWN